VGQEVPAWRKLGAHCVLLKNRMEQLRPSVVKFLTERQRRVPIENTSSASLQRESS
jgi:hypothetical protein